MDTQILSNNLRFQPKDPIFEASQLPKPLSITPDKNESVAVTLNFDSPLTDLDSSPRTPKDAVFDSFAPGPDELMLAPLVKKQVNSSRIDVARRLNFDSCVGVKDKSKQQQDQEVVLQEEEDDDEVLLGCVYRSLLDAIVKEVLADNNLSDGQEEEEEGSNGFKTPTRLPLLTGIADTCPAAPIKSRLVSKKIDLGLCRKLEF